jgi:hypothetical protein|tara:strand:+ start:351 stop:851 length:501 start_codon:yes stop_codon:yes gene_type:complete
MTSNRIIKEPAKYESFLIEYSHAVTEGAVKYRDVNGYFKVRLGGVILRPSEDHLIDKNYREYFRPDMFFNESGFLDAAEELALGKGPVDIKFYRSERLILSFNRNGASVRISTERTEPSSVLFDPLRCYESLPINSVIGQLKDVYIDVATKNGRSTDTRKLELIAN